MTAPSEPTLDRVRQRVTAAIGQHIPADHDETELRELFPDRYDSLAVLDTVGAVETEFGILVDLVNDDLRHTFASVATITDLVNRKLRDRAVVDQAF